jgi:glycosyltransferase involved in cell wall biosynthesis
MITVILASYNGGERLRLTLDSMMRVRSPRQGWRLIAVDNRSTDDSHSIMLSYKDTLPLDVLQEPVPGKNRALNRAVDFAIGGAESDLFVFCDDDVLVPENWLVEWRAVADAHLEYTTFAGKVLPHWPFEPPEWIARLVLIGVVFALHDADMREGECNTRYMFGPNMAIRLSVFRSGVRFNANIGPNGSPAYAMGSETDLGIRLARLGHKCWFSERPSVRHLIRPEQMDVHWVLERGYRYGLGAAIMEEEHLPYNWIRAKNRVRALVIPWLVPPNTVGKNWHWRWWWAFDQGYEDGTLERRGKPRRWRAPG